MKELTAAEFEELASHFANAYEVATGKKPPYLPVTELEYKGFEAQGRAMDEAGMMISTDGPQLSEWRGMRVWAMEDAEEMRRTLIFDPYARAFHEAEFKRMDGQFKDFLKEIAMKEEIEWFETAKVLPEDRSRDLLMFFAERGEMETGWCSATDNLFYTHMVCDECHAPGDELVKPTHWAYMPKGPR